jgi:hypothetical protein
LNEKYITQTAILGYITNYNLAESCCSTINKRYYSRDNPIGFNQQWVVVGATYHFYFGLNNGKAGVSSIL